MGLCGAEAVARREPLEAPFFCENQAVTRRQSLEARLRGAECRCRGHPTSILFSVAYAVGVTFPRVCAPRVGVSALGARQGPGCQLHTFGCSSVGRLPAAVGFVGLAHVQGAC